MRLIVFGTGQYYLNRMNDFSSEDEIWAFVDNRADEIQLFQGKHVYHPDMIKELDYDAILIMSADQKGMLDQLLSLEVKSEKILMFEEYKHLINRQRRRLLSRNTGSKENVLIVSEALQNNGGSRAAISAAISLCQIEYSVDIASAYFEDEIKKELEKYGIGAILCEYLPYVDDNDKEWAVEYDVIIVNVFQMIRVACEFSKYVPVLWWIHESSDRYNSFYKYARTKHWKYDNEYLFSKIRITAVSAIARDAFEMIYDRRIDSILPIGIIDESKTSYPNLDKEALTFATLGMVHPSKGQFEVAEAFEQIVKHSERRLRYRIIGDEISQDYIERIKGILKEESDVEFVGALDRETIMTEFDNIDVVVCGSYEETLCLAIVEGMMHSKICITTGLTGIADYITDGKNGFVCKAGDVESLKVKMQYVVDHYCELEEMKMKARETYNKYFTIERMAKALEEELKATMALYKGN